MTCTFFGHRDCPVDVKPVLRKVLSELITRNETDRFYVGNNGLFDWYVLRVLRELKEEFPHIDYSVVRAYLPGSAAEATENETVPEGVECVPPKYAVVYRNMWMLERADVVVVWVTRGYGGAARFVRQAERKNKLCINLAESMPQ